MSYALFTIIKYLKNKYLIFKIFIELFLIRFNKMSETEPIIQKKKRGRKPKVKTDEPVQVTVPKKRGRKPKPKTESDEPKLPKKRGRKPKDTSNIDVKNNFTQINEVQIVIILQNTQF